MPKRAVAITMLGTVLDGGYSAKRWRRWRPTVALCQHEDLLIHRLELLFEPKFQQLADRVIEDIAQVSPETRVRPVHVDTRDPWDFEQVYATLHDFARGYTFKPSAEDYLIHITTGTHVAQICLFLLTESRHFPGRLIQSSPPQPKKDAGPGTYRVIDLDLSKYDLIASRFRQEQREGLSFLKAGIDTKSKGFNTLIERIERVAVASEDPILLTGPTGAGKSQLARRIHELKRSRRQVQGELVEVNCATLRGDGAMSALFGHVRGAFTGALKDRPGLLRKADGGMLFLDEIAELGLDEQAMLLRAIEEKRFLPMGSDREVSSHFQLMAGTNRDVPKRVAEGRFRDDLYARINLWTFRLPSLAERREDIEPNIEFELERCRGRMGVNVTFNRPAAKRFMEFATSAEASWSGNFRDFGAAITRMATLAPGGRIDVAVVNEEVERLKDHWGGGTDSGAGAEQALVSVLGEQGAKEIDLFDQVQLAQVIKVCQKSATLSAAGRMLFAASRKKRTSVNDADRLRKYLARFGLDFKSLQSS